MRIGELATAARTQSETIRYYERQGLLPEAARTEANYRSYDESHIQRLAFIRHCRSLDMTLGGIRTLLHFKDAPTENCAEVNGLLDEHIGHVATRVRELKALEKQLKALREQCVSDHLAADCGILDGLKRGAQEQHQINTWRAQEGHIRGTHQQVSVANIPKSGS